MHVELGPNAHVCRTSRHLPVQNLALYLHARRQRSAVQVAQHVIPGRLCRWAGHRLYGFHRVCSSGTVLERYQALAQRVMRLHLKWKACGLLQGAGATEPIGAVSYATRTLRMQRRTP